MKLRTTFGLFAVVTLVSACSGGGDDDDPGFEMPSEDLTPLTEKYLGTYGAACRVNEAGTDYEVVALAVESQTAVIIINTYSDAACTNQIESRESTVGVSYPGGTVETERGPTDFVDIRLENFVLNGVTADLSQQPEENLNTYDIILLDGIDLYTGDGSGANDSLTPETRPDTLQRLPLMLQ